MILIFVYFSKVPCFTMLPRLITFTFKVLLFGRLMIDFQRCTTSYK